MFPNNHNMRNEIFFGSQTFVSHINQHHCIKNHMCFSRCRESKWHGTNKTRFWHESSSHVNIHHAFYMHIFKSNIHLFICKTFYWGINHSLILFWVTSFPCIPIKGEKHSGCADCSEAWSPLRGLTVLSFRGQQGFILHHNVLLLLCCQLLRANEVLMQLSRDVWQYESMRVCVCVCEVVPALSVLNTPLSPLEYVSDTKTSMPLRYIQDRMKDRT